MPVSRRIHLHTLCLAAPVSPTIQCASVCEAVVSSSVDAVCPSLPSLDGSQLNIFQGLGFFSSEQCANNTRFSKSIPCNAGRQPLENETSPAVASYSGSVCAGLITNYFVPTAIRDRAVAAVGAGISLTEAADEEWWLPVDTVGDYFEAVQTEVEAALVHKAAQLPVWLSRRWLVPTCYAMLCYVKV